MRVKTALKCRFKMTSKILEVDETFLTLVCQTDRFGIQIEVRNLSVKSLKNDFFFKFHCKSK